MQSLRHAINQTTDSTNLLRDLNGIISEYALALQIRFVDRRLRANQIQQEGQLVVGSGDFVTASHPLETTVHEWTLQFQYASEAQYVHVDIGLVRNPFDWAFDSSFGFTSVGRMYCVNHASRANQLVPFGNNDQVTFRADLVRDTVSVTVKLQNGEAHDYPDLFADIPLLSLWRPYVIASGVYVQVIDHCY
jgi:hypothetical protein